MERNLEQVPPLTFTDQKTSKDQSPVYSRWGVMMF